MRRRGALFVALSIGFAGTAYAQNTTTRVSVATNGTAANESSSTPAISADGRYVVFRSAATNLVSGDTNGVADIFLHDRQTGITQRVSLTKSGEQADATSIVGPSISGDGRFVVFASSATNLVSNDSYTGVDVFVRDRQVGNTTLVSVANASGLAGASVDGIISNDGRYIAFASDGSNLVANDTNGTRDIFRYDRMTGGTLRVSVGPGNVQSNGFSTLPAISADGRFISFSSSASNLATGDTNVVSDIFVRDMVNQTTTRVSVGTSGQGNGASTETTISFDGRFVTFKSAATNLVPNGGPGVYVHDRQSGITTALSINSAGSDLTSAPTRPKISGDGRYICFGQFAKADKFFELFVIDRQTLIKARASVASNGDAGNDGSADCAPNSDGTIVAFVSESTNLIAADGNARVDVFVRTMLASMALDTTSLTFAAATSGGTFISQTSAQTVRLTQSGVGSVTWTAASNQPWLHVAPASGTGSGMLSISVTPAAGLPESGTVTGQIAVTLTGAVNALPPIAVTLTLVPSTTTLGPFGLVDTPTDNRTGVTGSVPFTGWALDDLEVTRVSICRAAFGMEVAPVDPNCGGAAEIFVGFAVFIDDARPDVASTFAAFPLATRAGWGFMLLTNMLPNQGNGTYRFTARAQDLEGRWFVLGTRTMTCANASATLPFGTLDTPLQGGVASGASYINFGWALTPLPKTIPIDGSTIHVLVDGVDYGTADYNHARSDIQALFPGLNNTNGAVGFRILDTTLLDNGLHTISWTVTDNQGAIEGIGSRFFTVSNGVAAITAAPLTAASTGDIAALPLDATAVAGRRGWDLEAAHEVFGAGVTGAILVRSEEVSRVELQLGAGEYRGYLRTASGLAPLPIGSRLEAATNTFTWAPAVGFVGRYELVFVRSIAGRAVSRRDIRVVLHPKGRGSVGPQVVIDLPTDHATVQAPFMIGGWAADLDAAHDTGVTTLHAWAYPSAGGAPIFLGATVYGGARPDVAAVHGSQFKDSGFGLIVQGLAAGDYDLAIFAWSTERMGFVAPTVVRVSVTP